MHTVGKGAFIRSYELIDMDATGQYSTALYFLSD